MRHTHDLRADYTPASGLGRTFDNLHIRPKLIVLHNLFFFLLGVSVYFAVIPPFERRVATAKTIEISLITEILATDRPLGCKPEKLLQGPVADGLTHVGQVMMLRRLASAPVRSENYAIAEIVPGRVTAEQAAPRFEFD